MPRGRLGCGRRREHPGSGLAAACVEEAGSGGSTRAAGVLLLTGFMKLLVSLPGLPLRNRGDVFLKISWEILWASLCLTPVASQPAGDGDPRDAVKERSPPLGLVGG